MALGLKQISKQMFEEKAGPGSVTVRAWNGSSGFGFGSDGSFGERVFCAFQCSLRGWCGSGFGS